MTKTTFLQQIPAKFRKGVRRYTNALIKKDQEEKPNTCKNCKCQDLEDWLHCSNKK